MGTRGLTVVKIDGETKIAQYGQWDHYASGQGLDALKILRDPALLSALREKAPQVQEASYDYLRSLDSAGVPVTPVFSRSTGAKILRIVAESEPGLLVKSDPDFANDGLFCEGIATVDFDANTYTWHEPGYEGEGVLTLTYPLDALPSEDDFLADARVDDEDDD